VVILFSGESHAPIPSGAGLDPALPNLFCDPYLSPHRLTESEIQRNNKGESMLPKPRGGAPALRKIWDAKYAHTFVPIDQIGHIQQSRGQLCLFWYKKQTTFCLWLQTGLPFF